MTDKAVQQVAVSLQELADTYQAHPLPGLMIKSLAQAAMDLARKEVKKEDPMPIPVEGFTTPTLQLFGSYAQLTTIANQLSVTDKIPNQVLISSVQGTDWVMQSVKQKITAAVANNLESTHQNQLTNVVWSQHEDFKSLDKIITAKCYTGKLPDYPHGS